MNWRNNRAVKVSCYRCSVFGLGIFAGVFFLSTSQCLLAQALGSDVNRNLVNSGKPVPAPSALKPRRIPAEATAVVDLGTGVSATAYCRQGRFDRVGLRHDQMVDIAVQYSTADAGKTIAVEPLDGGQIIAPAKNLIVSSDGMIHFKFHAGHSPGVYQIALRNAGQELGLQFWVLDDEHPANNPRVINPEN